MQNKNIPADTPLDHLWNWLYQLCESTLICHICGSVFICEWRHLSNVNEFIHNEP